MRGSGNARYAVGIAGMLLTSCIGLQAVAQTTSDTGASILIFPKVIADGTRDTVIQITNVGNSFTHVRCFYVNAVPGDPQQPPGPSNLPQFAIADFSMLLTKQQPTYWVVSRGRSVGLGDPTAPGNIQAASPGFQGELLCVQMSEDGFPFIGNHLIGQATLEDRTSGDIAKYSAIGIAGNPDLLPSSVLCLGGTFPDTCANPGVYEGCPAAWMLDHLADGAEDPQVGAGSSVRTELTVVSCSQDLAVLMPSQATIQFLVTNEFEERFSASTTVTWWSNTALAEIGDVFTVGVLGSVNARTRLSPVPSLDGLSSGFLIVAQEFHSGGSTPVTASAAVNAHAEGVHNGGDVIILP